MSHPCRANLARCSIIGIARRGTLLAACAVPPIGTYHCGNGAEGRTRMRTSTDHILTSHVGSLPRPDELIAANRARDGGEATDEGAFQATLSAAVMDAVRRQHQLSIDVP